MEQGISESATRSGSAMSQSQTRQSSAGRSRSVSGRVGRGFPVTDDGNLSNQDQPLQPVAFLAIENSIRKPQQSSQEPGSTKRRGTSPKPGQWNNMVPRKPRNFTVTTKNAHVSCPFKHSVHNSCEQKLTVCPGREMTEKTVIATSKVAKVIANQETQEERKHRGKLQKARLKPLVTVNVQGPTMDHCRGIVSASRKSASNMFLSGVPVEVGHSQSDQSPVIQDPLGILQDSRSYSKNVSRTLQRRRNILATISKDYIFERPQTGESIHRTSIASDLSDTRMNDFDEENKDGRADQLSSSKAVRFQEENTRMKSQTDEDDDSWDETNDNNNNNRKQKSKKNRRQEPEPVRLSVRDVSEGFWDSSAHTRPQSSGSRSRVGWWTDRQRPDEETTWLSVQGTGQGNNDAVSSPRLERGKYLEFELPCRTSPAAYRPYARSSRGQSPEKFIQAEQRRLCRSRGQPRSNPNRIDLADDELVSTRAMRLGRRGEVMVDNVKRSTRPRSAPRRPRSGVKVRVRPATANVGRAEADLGHRTESTYLADYMTNHREDDRQKVEERNEGGGNEMTVDPRDLEEMTRKLDDLMDAQCNLSAAPDDGPDSIVPQRLYRNIDPVKDRRSCDPEEVLDHVKEQRSGDPEEELNHVKEQRSGDPEEELSSKMEDERVSDPKGDLDPTETTEAVDPEQNKQEAIDKVATDMVTSVLERIGVEMTENESEAERKKTEDEDITREEHNQSEVLLHTLDTIEQSLDDVHQEIKDCMDQTQEKISSDAAKSTMDRSPLGRSDGRKCYEMTVYQYNSDEVTEFKVMLVKEKQGLGSASMDPEQRALSAICQQLTAMLRAGKKGNGHTAKRSMDQTPVEVLATMKALTQPRLRGLRDADRSSQSVRFLVNSRPPPGLIYFFALGSDMNPERFGSSIQRVITPESWAILYGFKLMNDSQHPGCPCLEFDGGSCVEGCVYLISPQELESLDRMTNSAKVSQHLLLPVWLLNCSVPGELGLAQYCVPAIASLPATHDVHLQRCLSHKPDPLW